MQATVVLATLGSLGDLHPFIALGRALRARGANVVMACASEYRDKVEGADLVFRAVRPSFADLERRLGMEPAELTSAMLARNDFLLRDVLMPHLRQSYDDMADILAGADLLVASSLAFGARLAAERQGLPWVGVALQPMMFLSAFDAPVIPHAEWLSALLRRLGHIPTGWVLALAKLVVARQLRPVHALRNAIGLAPTGVNPLFGGQFSANGAIGLYSPLLGEARRDFPPAALIAGFAVFDGVCFAGGGESGPGMLEAGLEKFLNAGVAPLIFTLGSLIVNSPGKFFRESAAAAKLMRRRAVLLVGEGACERYAELRSSDIYIGGYAPHSLLFPRAAAIVHQGGIGTLAQALHSGRPQLIVPHYGDQADNAARAIRLGVALSLAPHRYRAARVARRLLRLTGSADHVSRAGAVRRRLADEDGAATAAAFLMNRLESNVGASRPQPPDGSNPTAGPQPATRHRGFS